MIFTGINDLMICLVDDRKVGMDHTTTTPEEIFHATGHDWPEWFLMIGRFELIFTLMRPDEDRELTIE